MSASDLSDWEDAIRVSVVRKMRLHRHETHNPDHDYTCLFCCCLPRLADTAELAAFHAPVSGKTLAADAITVSIFRLLDRLLHENRDDETTVRNGIPQNWPAAGVCQSVRSSAILLSRLASRPRVKLGMELPVSGKTLAADESFHDPSV